MLINPTFCMWPFLLYWAFDIPLGFSSAGESTLSLFFEKKPSDIHVCSRF